MIYRALLLLSFLFLTGCFETGGENSAKSESGETSSLIGAADFSGALAARNVITGIQITWNSSNVTPSAYRIYRVNGTKLTLLATVSSEVNGFIDGTVSWGTTYSYIVRAVDKNNIEDKNMTKVSSLSWAGISSAAADGRNSIRVVFAGTTAVADEIRIYIQDASGGNKTLATTISGSDSEAVISGLRTGFPYIISAQAYVSTLKKEDGNSATFKVTTETLGYHDDNASAAKWLNVTNVRAFGASPGAAVHPSFPERTPRTELVELSFRSFSGMDATTQYIVERTNDGLPLDTSVETPCETTTVGSCRVKCTSSSFTLTGSGILNCRDEKVGPSPLRYRYTMSILHSEGSLKWAEPVPESELEYFSVLVPMPPANMNLAQRDAVNYEMCNQMNAAIDPRRHNRCPYTGVGAVPYNSGPGRPALTFESGFYDYGYNLFVDRFEQACRWTRAVDGGMCGAGGTAGDCIGSMAANIFPANTIGKNGDVYLGLWANSETTCFYKFQGSWLRSTSVSTSVPNPRAALATMYTSDPTANGGKVASLREYHSAYQGWSICQSQSDSSYGAKRLPRVREYRGYAAMATMPNDLYGISYTTANNLAGGGSYNSTTGYRCPFGQSIANYTYPATITDVLNSTNEILGIYSGGQYYGNSFQLGAVANVDCQGRYGIQNVINKSTSLWTSDSFNWDSTTKLLTGTTSFLDSGNKDLQQDINGGQTGFVIDYTNAIQNGTTNYYFQLSNSASSAVNFILLPLGLPVLSMSSTVYLPRATFLENYGSNFYAPYSAAPNTTPRSVATYNRWATYTAIASGPVGNNVTSTRCVLPAD